MGETRDLFQKIRDTKGTFHANTGTRDPSLACPGPHAGPWTLVVGLTKSHLGWPLVHQEWPEGWLSGRVSGSRTSCRSTQGKVGTGRERIWVLTGGLAAGSEGPTLC